MGKLDKAQLLIPDSQIGKFCSVKTWSKMLITYCTKFLSKTAVGIHAPFIVPDSSGFRRQQNLSDYIYIVRILLVFLELIFSIRFKKVLVQ